MKVATEPRRWPSVMSIDVPSLRMLIDLGGELAVLDIREQSASDAGHVLGATNLPRRELESSVERLVPRRGTTVVVLDGGPEADGGLADRVGGDLVAHGYTDVRLLDGGLAAWARAGEHVATGHSVPSKDFGELVQHHDEVPTVQADELRRWQTEGRELLICDVRTVEEHRRETIPGSVHVPGFELAGRVDELAGPKSTVVVHCSGRTRSIIGAASLRLSGRDDVVALENGTMGWMLAGLQADRGVERRAPLDESACDLALRQRWRRHASAVGVRYLPPIRAARLLDSVDAHRHTVHLFDVRTRERFDLSHPTGSRWAPSGQLVQLTDRFVAVHGATLMLICDDTVRSSIAAYWLRRMGHQRVAVIDGGIDAWQVAGLDMTSRDDPTLLGLSEARATVPTTTPEQLREWLMRDPTIPVVHVSASTEYETGHLSGAVWVSPTWLERDLETAGVTASSPVVFTCADGIGSLLAAAKAVRAGWGSVSVLDGGVKAWTGTGGRAETGPVEGSPDDVFLHPIERGPDAMRAYLEWEIQLGETHEPTRPVPSRQ